MVHDDDDEDDDDGIDRSKWIKAFARILQRLIDPVFHKQQTKNVPATSSNQ